MISLSVVMYPDIHLQIKEFHIAGICLKTTEILIQNSDFYYIKVGKSINLGFKSRPAIHCHNNNYIECKYLKLLYLFCIENIQVRQTTLDRTYHR